MFIKNQRPSLVLVKAAFESLLFRSCLCLAFWPFVYVCNCRKFPLVDPTLWGRDRLYTSLQKGWVVWSWSIICCNGQNDTTYCRFNGAQAAQISLVSAWNEWVENPTVQIAFAFELKFSKIQFLPLARCLKDRKVYKNLKLKRLQRQQLGKGILTIPSFFGASK